MLRPGWRKRCPGRQTLAERFILRGRFVPKRARNETRHGINHQHRGKFAAAQNEVADRDFFRRQMLRHALVDSFISPANKNDALELRIAPRGLLIEYSSSRGHQDDRGFWIARGLLPHVPNALTEKRLHRFEKRLWLQHHALATAERPVIHGAMTILRERPLPPSQGSRDQPAFDPSES